MVDHGELAALPPLPDRPTLRPGLHVVRRDPATLQIGVDPPRRVVAPDTAGVRALLDDLRAARVPRPADPIALACLSSLLAAGMVADADHPETDRAHFGLDARRRSVARAAAGIGVAGSEPFAARAAGLLANAGLRPAGPDEAPTAWLVVCAGEPARGRLDELVREGAPHLVVTSREARIELGPFVLPGRTACLRCVDAHRAERDPRRHLVVEQVAWAVAGGAPEPRDDVLWSLALSWAARDLLRFVEGDRPSTWSATVEIGPCEAPRPHPWRRHPHCGCSWDEGLALLY